MKRKNFIFVLVLLGILFTGILTPVCFAADFESIPQAKEYLDGYSENVSSDPDFSVKIQQGIKWMQSEISVYATALALLPPVVAIILALITKEVYSSLFVGILVGGLLYSNFNPWGMVTDSFQIMISKLSSPWNVGILVFLVCLGMIVSLVNKAGGTAAYGRWASRYIKTRVGAILATSILGMMIFIDDYFNCLTVGSVMRPLTDRHHVSREKLAYIIDATAAPVCIIAPISSWAAAVSSVAPEGQGLKLFVRSIPYNFYALLTIVMVVVLGIMNFDFGKMRLAEVKAQAETQANKTEFGEDRSTKGKVIDLVLPICALICCCVMTMVYTGGFFDHTSGNFGNFIDAFGASDASVGLVLGSFLTICAIFILYIPRKIMTAKEFMESFGDGFKLMASAILILTFAWTLSGITNELGAKIFVAEIVRNAAVGLESFLPAVVFLIAVGLAFATGTSWGTFGILLPIVCSIFQDGELMIIAVSACLAGAVAGDHCSPISDTTIMASTGAQCEHISHVSTQLPYALLCDGVSFIGFILAGLIQNVLIVLPVTIGLLIFSLFVIRTVQRKKNI